MLFTIALALLALFIAAAVKLTVVQILQAMFGVAVVSFLRWRFFNPYRRSGWRQR